jgi:hypothetical protein
MEVKYTNLMTESHLLVQSVRSDLTPALGKLSVSLFLLLQY